MGYRYAILGGGRQGLAAAYDVARFGDAEAVTVFDHGLDRAEATARRVNELVERDVATGAELDVRDGGCVQQSLDGIDATVAAVPYFFTPSVAFACIHAGSHLCDLGGNTGIARRVLSLDDEARAAGVAIVPDCGLAPGLCNALATYGMEMMDDVDTVRVRCGGLPQNPKPPLFYKMVFNIAGLTDLYFGEATVLREGRVTKVETFSGLEEIDFPDPVGRCEAFITSGGTSTCPWTFEGKVREFDYKTVRYPGHYDRFKVMRDLGLLDLQPVELHGQKIIPRDFFHAVVKPRLRFPDDRDLVVLRVSVTGKKDGHDQTVVLEIIDFHDEKVGFSAMQRTTGFTAGTVAVLMAQGEIEPGATSLEAAVCGAKFVEAFKQRGVSFTESVQRTTSGETPPTDAN